jgi:4-amino-4-deoxy-L-arabinose transferase-like glycosyltransferase
MKFKSLLQQLFRSETWWVWSIVGLTLALNVAFHGRHGYFRDELYYIACSDHLAWGSVDQPPLCALILAVTRWLLGDSLYAIRFVPALAGAGVVVLAGSTARLLGGKKFAQLLAAAAAALSPVILGNATRNFSMNAFDLFFWALLARIVIKIIVQERPICGSGLEWPQDWVGSTSIQWAFSSPALAREYCSPRSGGSCAIAASGWAL